MPKSLSIEFPFMPPTELRGNGRPAHWAVRNRKVAELRAATAWRLRELDIFDAQDGTPAYFDKAVVKYTAHYCGKPIDRDGLIQGMKAALDEVVAKRVVWDDNPRHVTGIQVEYVRVKHRGEVKLVMEVIDDGNGNKG